MERMNRGSKNGRVINGNQYSHDPISNSINGSEDCHTENCPDLQNNNTGKDRKSSEDENIISEEILEDNLIRRILTAGSSVGKSHKIMSDEQDSANVPDSEYEERKDFIDYIQDIVKKISFKTHAHKFLIFVAACERNKAIFKAIQSEAAHKFDKSMLNKFKLKSKEDTDEVSEIVNQALEYVISQKAIESLQYILTYCLSKYIIPCVQDYMVLELIRELKSHTSFKIIELLMTYEVLISYSGTDEESIDNPISKKISYRNPKSKTKLIKDHKLEPLAKSTEEEKEEFTKKLAKMVCNGNKQIKSEYNTVLPKRFTVDGEYFKSEHAIEIMFRSEAFSDDQEIEIIKKLCGDLENIGNTSTRIIKLLVTYDKFKLFCDIIDSKSINQYHRQQSLDKISLMKLESNTHDEVIINYYVEDIICEAATYCLKIDNIPFLEQIFNVYRIKIELRSLEVQKFLIESFTECLNSNRQICYLFDKINFLHSLISSVNTEVSIALEYIQIMRRLIKQSHDLNIFTSYHNPLRLFIMFVEMLHVFGSNTESMGIDLKIIQEEVENLMIQILDDLTNIDFLRNWLFDKYTDGLKVIDLLAQLDLLRILNHNKIAKVAEQVWSGNYEQSK